MSELNIPEHWAETHLGEISEYTNGRGFKSEEWDLSGKGLPIIRIQNLNKNNRDYNNFNYYNGAYDEKIYIKTGDLLFCWSGAVGTSFGARIYEGPNGLLNQHIFKVCLPKGVLPFFYLHQLTSLLSEVQKRIHGGVGLVHITKGKLLTIPFTLPPLKEQLRVIQKIESCFQKIDETEKALNEVEVLLTKYRESLLAKAFRGELIPQDPKDEPASKLLEKIRTKRAKNLKGKKVQEFAPISDNEKPFDLPGGWEWVRLGDLCDSREITYGVIKLGDHSPDGVPCLRTSDVRPGFIDISDVKKISNEISSNYSRTVLQGGEVLINVRGTLGGVAVVPEELKGYNISREVSMISLAFKGLSNWIHYWIRTPVCINLLSNVTKGGVYRGINLEDLRLLPVPIGPLEELKQIDRIMEKVDLTIANEIQKIENQLLILKKLNDSILSQAFQGSLVPRVLDEGTGQELLSKILDNKTELEKPEKKASKKVNKKTVKKKAKK